MLQITRNDNVILQNENVILQATALTDLAEHGLRVVPCLSYRTFFNHFDLVLTGGMIEAMPAIVKIAPVHFFFFKHVIKKIFKKLAQYLSAPNLAQLDILPSKSSTQVIFSAMVFLGE